MEEILFINIDFEGKKREIEAHLRIWDHCHQIEVEVDDTVVTFELGKRSHYHAVMSSVLQVLGT